MHVFCVSLETVCIQAMHMHMRWGFFSLQKSLNHNYYSVASEAKLKWRRGELRLIRNLDQRKKKIKELWLCLKNSPRPNPRSRRLCYYLFYFQTVQNCFYRNVAIVKCRYLFKIPGNDIHNTNVVRHLTKSLRYRYRSG